MHRDVKERKEEYRELSAIYVTVPIGLIERRAYRLTLVINYHHSCKEEPDYEN